MSVYLDHAATTPMRAESLTAYTEALAHIGNPASIHSTGQRAKQRLEESRETIARSLGCDPIEVILTSGGTESINLALKGLFWSRNADGTRPIMLVPGGEHHATIDTVEWLASHDGADVRWLPLDDEGMLQPAALDQALTEAGDACAVVTVIHANNEVGTVQPIVELSRVCARYDVPLHVDAVAAYGHLPIDVADIRTRSGAVAASGLVALSVSAHKIGGPVGVGALYLSRSATVEPLMHGGGQQRDVRSGTQDVAGAIAFAAAAEPAMRELPDETRRLEALRDALIEGVEQTVPDVVVNGSRQNRLPGNAHFSFPGCEGDSLLFLLDMAGVAVSTGSACQAGIPEPSHVLQAMGRDEKEARGALRVSLGRTTTRDDVDAFLTALPGAHRQAHKAGLSDRDVTRR
ncbi:cysteine desulfurase family protein [Paramicrobacterium agarici]|uniref:Cysteine desulfurase n=1 Tax=Paramicrobacterium agarici TaxID=630514 RepID=A0A2A9DZZ3_9MICO|nr:cysteine desulfurase family protein [Microbacterium agarici]PFG31499.1 cysteine desulfurase [Microbacterium agarici]TQO21387.1 cysteine desulfurase [Microbacterium agarici]